jgi:mannose-6-phosphate isomerase-like protein (cupin superfamily)
VRFDNKGAEAFVGQFFPELRMEANELRMELSPKFLLVAPGARLSWQRHARRAERWAYLSPGGYHKSTDPSDQGEMIPADAGDVVQFEQGECHRLVGLPGDRYTLVAEIWQHTNPQDLSDEADIERLEDDYSR